MAKKKMRLRDFLKEGVVKNHEDIEPQFDIAYCSVCDFRGVIEDCIEEQDGDWESGYFTVHECPKCEDHSGEVSYDYSDEHLKLYLKWEKENK